MKRKRAGKQRKVCYHIMATFLCCFVAMTTNQPTDGNNAWYQTVVADVTFSARNLRSQQVLGKTKVCSIAKGLLVFGKAGNINHSRRRCNFKALREGESPTFN